MKEPELRTSTKRISEVPEMLQPREMMKRYGAEFTPTYALLALLLRSGTKKMNVSDLAQGLLEHYGSLGRLALASPEELAAFPGLGEVKGQIIQAALELARRLSEEKVCVGQLVDSPQAVADVLGVDAQLRNEEVFWVLLLDSQNRLYRKPVEVTRGILNASLAHPREVFRTAIHASAASVILAHNHPSGSPEPSSQDLNITRKLIEAGKILDIPVLDHVILGRKQSGTSTWFRSLRESDLLPF